MWARLGHVFFAVGPIDFFPLLAQWASEALLGNFCGKNLIYMYRSTVKCELIV